MKKVYKVVYIQSNNHRVSSHAYGRYKIDYIKKSILKIGGVGAMCFKTYKDANRFMANCASDSLRYKIIEIEPLCGASRPKFWTPCYSTSFLDRFYKKNGIKHDKHMIKTKPSHNGTVCYKKIRVLT